MESSKSESSQKPTMNVITIMRYVPEIQFDAGNVDIELCIKSVLKDSLYLMLDKYINIKQ